MLTMFRNWRDRREAFREMDRERRLNAEHVGFKVNDELAYAIAALREGDRPAAQQIWDAIHRRYPDEVIKSPEATRILMGLHRFDEAEALLKAGEKRHRGHHRFTVSLAELATERAQVSRKSADFDAAIGRWAVVRKQFPGVVEGYTSAASALLHQGRYAEAEVLATQAVDQFPNDIGGYLALAWAADHQQQWDLAVERWRRVQDRFQHRDAYVSCSRAMTNLGRYDEARTMIVAAEKNIGTDRSFAAELIRLDLAEGLHDKALAGWAGFLEKFPTYIYGYFDAAEAFLAMGNQGKAEDALRAAIDRFPQEQRPRQELARLFHYRLQYPAAADAWMQLREAFPDCEEAYTRGAEALDQAGRVDEAAQLRIEAGRRF